MPNHFVEHLKDTVSVKFRKFSKQFQKLLSFSSEPFLDLASSRGGAVRPVLPSYPLRRTIAWRLAGVGDEQEEVRHPVSDGSSGLCGCQREAQHGRRRPAPPKPPEATAWPSTHPCTLRSFVVNC